MEKAKKGDTVKIHFTGKFENGTVLDESYKNDPLEFTIGEKKILQELQEAVIGMKPGESKSQRIPAEQVFGPYSEDLTFVVEQNKISSEVNFEVGEIVRIETDDGKITPVLVTDVSESGVTFDANCFIGGQDLIYEIYLIKIIN